MPLKPGGECIEVTNANKLEYLNLLAQYKLVSRVKEELEYFLKGVHCIHTLYTAISYIYIHMGQSSNARHNYVLNGFSVSTGSMLQAFVQNHTVYCWR